MSGFLFSCRVLQTRFGWDVLSDMGILPRPPEAVRLEHTRIINEDIADETGTSRYDEAQTTSERTEISRELVTCLGCNSLKL